MIIDTSALAAIVLGEAEREHFVRLIDASSARKISAASVVEVFEIYHRRLRLPKPLEAMAADLARLDITIVAVTGEQAMVAAQARMIYGKGTQHPAQLNYGDCFSYALAKVLDQPLLFKGDDFIHTDLKFVV